MKTAVSLSDQLHRSADALARRLGISRSALYATALAEFVAKHQDAKVTERLNAVYAGGSNKLDPALAKSQRRAIRHSEW